MTLYQTRISKQSQLKFNNEKMYMYIPYYILPTITFTHHYVYPPLRFTHEYVF